MFQVEDEIEFNSLTCGNSGNGDGYDQPFIENSTLATAKPQFLPKNDFDSGSQQPETAHSHGEAAVSYNSRSLLSKSSISRAQARKYRRLNRLYSSRLKTDTLPKSTTPMMNSAVTNNKQPTENECFSQYISSVLTRFSANKQRKCRNEILRIILKYDIGDDEHGSDVA